MRRRAFAAAAALLYAAGFLACGMDDDDPGAMPPGSDKDARALDDVRSSDGSRAVEDARDESTQVGDGGSVHDVDAARDAEVELDAGDSSVSEDAHSDASADASLDADAGPGDGTLACGNYSDSFEYFSKSVLWAGYEAMPETTWGFASDPIPGAPINAYAEILHVDGGGAPRHALAFSRPIRAPKKISCKVDFTGYMFMGDLNIDVAEILVHEKGGATRRLRVHLGGPDWRAKFVARTELVGADGGCTGACPEAATSSTAVYGDVDPIKPLTMLFETDFKSIGVGYGNLTDSTPASFGEPETVEVRLGAWLLEGYDMPYQQNVEFDNLVCTLDC